MIRRPAFLLLCLLLPLFGGGSAAAPLRVGFYNAPPLMNQHSADGGIYQQLLADIGRRTGLQFISSYYPSARLNRLFEQGELDIEPGINPQWRIGSAEPGLYSEPFGVLRQMIVFADGTGISVHSAADLEGREIGTIRGYIYPGFMQAFARGRLRRLDVTDEPQLLELLRHQRVGQIFVDDVAFHYWQAQNPDYRQFRDGSIIARVEIMLRLHPRHRELLPQLNRAISEMRADGTLKRLFSPYQH